MDIYITKIAKKSPNDYMVKRIKVIIIENIVMDKRK